MKKAILAIILGVIALGTGLLGYGGYMFGIPALILGILTARETGAPRIIGVIGLVFGCIGIAETTVVLTAVTGVEEAVKPGLVEGISGETVTIRNWGVVVTPPMYTGVFYEEAFEEGEYLVYEPREGYQFALVKLMATNIGKEEGSPDFYDFKLVTTGGLRYKRKSAWDFESTTESLESPSPLPEEFSTIEHVLPSEQTEGYIYFQIPEDAVADYLSFKYGLFPAVKVKIKLIS